MGSECPRRKLLYHKVVLTSEIGHRILHLISILLCLFNYLDIYISTNNSDHQQPIR